MERTSCIGIDLGTTYSCVGVWRNDRVEIIANDQGNRTTPSYVAFTETDLLVGDAARNQSIRNLRNTVYDAKRLIGRKYNDPSVQSDMHLWPFQVVEGPKNRPQILVRFKGVEKRFYPEEISSMILSKMKETAEGFLGKRVENAVVTVPAYFSDSQRQATKDAGEIAGLNVLRIINEPTAAAIAYGFNERTGEEKKILVFDLGGGTFDVSVLVISDGIFQVKAVNGDTHLGGQDFDERMVQHLLKDYRKKFHRDLSQNQRAVGRLRLACERAKRVLSNASQASIELDGLDDGNDFFTEISRAKFDMINEDYFDRCFKLVEKVLIDAELAPRQIDEVVLVGGSTRIVRVQEMIREFFCKDFSLSVNPDEAVAFGAAIQGAILADDPNELVQSLLLLDVTPLSLGTKVIGGIMDVIIPRNTMIPTKKSKSYTTVRDDQPSMPITVYEGERLMAADNNLLGKFSFTGIPPAPRGVPSIENTFEINADGILHITAFDKTTRNIGELTIQNDKNRLSREEIVALIAEAEIYRSEDELRKSKAEARNNLENCIYHVKKLIGKIAGLDLVDTYSKMSLISKLERTLSWLEQNANAEVADYEAYQFELANLANSIIQKFNTSLGSLGSHLAIISYRK